MKKAALSTLSIALLGAVNTAHAQSSVTLYGTIDTSIAYTHGNASAGLGSLGTSSNRLSMETGDMSNSTWGVHGTEDLGGGVKAVFQLESAFRSNDGSLLQGDRLFNEQALVGLKSDQYGTVTFGRQHDTAADQVEPITADGYFSTVFATPGGLDNNDSSIGISNAVKYTSPVIAGLQFEAMYGFGGVAGSMGSGQTYSVAASYHNGGLGVAGGYLHLSNLSGAANRPKGWSSGLQNDLISPASSDALFISPLNAGYASARSIGIAQVAGQYVIGPVTLGLGYSNAQYVPDADSDIGFARTEKYNTGRAFVAYQASQALMLGAGYAYTKSSGNVSAKYHQFSLGADCWLSKRTDIYLVGAYQHASGLQQQVSPDTGELVAVPAMASIGSYLAYGAQSQAVVSLGMRHSF